jgi:hypothetical protein
VPGKPRTRRQWILIATVSVGVTLAVILPLAYVPVPQSSNFSLPGCGSGGHAMNFPMGTSVSGGWEEPDGSNVSFSVGQTGYTYYSHIGSNGSFQFSVRLDGSVDFFAGPPTAYPPCQSADVQVAVHWSSPILWWLSGPD